MDACLAGMADSIVFMMTPVFRKLIVQTRSVSYTHPQYSSTFRIDLMDKINGILVQPHEFRGHHGSESGVVVDQGAASV